MKSCTLPLLAGLGLAACAPYGYTRAEIIYGEPTEYVYVTPVERVVVVTREVLVSRGWVAVRTVAEQRDRGRHRGWERREPPREIVGDIDGRLREHRDH